MAHKGVNVNREVKNMEDIPRSYSERLKIFINDLAVMVCCLALLRPLCVLLLAGDLSSFKQVVKSKPDVILWCVWPVVALVLLLMFRDALMRVLYQLPSFIARSQYGNPVVSSEKEPEQPNEEDVPIGKESEGDNHNDKIQPNGGLQKMNIEQGRRAAELVLQIIGREFRCKIDKEVRIRGSSYVFDGAMVDGEEIYGIEVKCGYNRTMIRTGIRRLMQVESELPPKVRDHFSLILCVVSKQATPEWKLELRQIAESEGFRGGLRMYSIEELSDRERKSR